MVKEQLQNCRHCSSEEGYYFKTKIRGNVETRYKFNGSYEEEDNQDMHDGLIYKFSKWTYCRSCHKRLFKGDQNNEKPQQQFE